MWIYDFCWNIIWINTILVLAKNLFNRKWSIYFSILNWILIDCNRAVQLHRTYFSKYCVRSHIGCGSCLMLLKFHGNATIGSLSLSHILACSFDCVLWVYFRQFSSSLFILSMYDWFDVKQSTENIFYSVLTIAWAIQCILIPLLRRF